MTLNGRTFTILFILFVLLLPWFTTLGGIFGRTTSDRNRRILPLRGQGKSSKIWDSLERVISPNYIPWNNTEVELKANLKLDKRAEDILSQLKGSEPKVCFISTKVRLVFVSSESETGAFLIRDETGVVSEFRHNSPCWPGSQWINKETKVCQSDCSLEEQIDFCWDGLSSRWEFKYSTSVVLFYPGHPTKRRIDGFGDIYFDSLYPPSFGQCHSPTPRTNFTPTNTFIILLAASFVSFVLFSVLLLILIFRRRRNMRSISLTQITLPTHQNEANISNDFDPEPVVFDEINEVIAHMIDDDDSNMDVVYSVFEYQMNPIIINLNVKREKELHVFFANKSEPESSSLSLMGKFMSKYPNLRHVCLYKRDTNDIRWVLFTMESHSAEMSDPQARFIIEPIKVGSVFSEMSRDDYNKVLSMIRGF